MSQANYNGNNQYMQVKPNKQNFSICLLLNFKMAIRLTSEQVKVHSENTVILCCRCVFFSVKKDLMGTSERNICLQSITALFYSILFFTDVYGLNWVFDWPLFLSLYSVITVRNFLQFSTSILFYYILFYSPCAKRCLNQMLLSTFHQANFSSGVEVQLIKS